MHASPRRSRLLALMLTGGALALAVVAVPVLGQGAGTGASDAPGVAAPPSDTPGKGPKASKVPEEPVTLSGTVGTRTDEDGATVYTLTAGGTAYDLEAGPPWFWGDDHPLAPFVGRQVTIGGEKAEGSTSVDVQTVDGTAIREPGRPPWAGGWKAVGERHPGWAKWKADKAAAKAEEKAGKTQGRPSWAGPKQPEASPGN
jgi:hypothetical protein